MPRPLGHSSAGETRTPWAPGSGVRLALLQQLLDQLLMGVILVDARAHPSFLNDQARDLLAHHDGLWMGPDGLKASNAGDTRRLRHAIALTAASAGGECPAGPRYLGLRRRSRRAAPWLLRLSPLPGPPPEVMLLVTTPEHLRPLPPEALAVAFGLTPREAALAGMLADGHELRDCARLLAMAEGTARNHLKHVFEKTVQHNQATLVAALCRMAVPCR